MTFTLARSTARTDGTTHRITARLVLPILALFMLLTTAWSLATPLAASPDEPAHIVRAGAVVRGEPIGVPNDAADYPTIQVPDFVYQVYGLTCTAGDPTVTADCQGDVPTGDKTVVTNTSASLNSPVYYALVGWPSLFLSGAPAFYAMRIVSALLTSMLLTTMVVALLAQSRTWWPVAASVVGVTPMVLFLGGSVNPNAPELAAAGAVFALLSLMVRRPLSNKHLWVAGSLTVASAFALTAGRSIGVLWLAVAGLAVILSVPWATIAALLKRRVVWFTLAGVGVAAVVPAVWMSVYAATMAGAPTEIEPRAPGLTAIVLLMAESTFDYWSGWIGQFGWIDYAAPAGTMVIWYGAIAAVLFAGLALTRGRPRIALIFLAAVAFIVPIAVQTSFYNEIGWMWQGRYAIPLYLCVLIAAGLALDETFPDSKVATARTAVVAGVALLGATQVATFVFVLRRYVVGSQSWIAMVQDPSWQPPLGWMLLTALFALTWAAAVVLLARWTRTEVEARF